MQGWHRLIGFTLVIGLVPLAAFAQQPAYFAGKTVTVLIPSNPGGGIDAYSRLLARHLGKHIPGNPSVTVQNMSGAGGLRALNYLAAKAPQDGTNILNVNSGNLIQELLGEPGMEISLGKLAWIGDLSQSNPVDVTYPHSETRTIQDAMTRVTRVGATGVASSPAQIAWAYNALVGTKYDVILGYTGAGEYDLAIQRGELDGRNVTSLGSYLAAIPDDVRPKLHLLAQLGMKKDPKVPADVPLLLDLVKGDHRKEEAAKLLSLAFASINRPFAVAPGVPADRIAMLRTAFDATMRDPQFLADAQILQADISPTNGADLEVIVKQALSFPPDVVEFIRTALKQPEK